MRPTDPDCGLSETEALDRLARFGPNALSVSARRGPFKIMAETLREPMFVLLIGAACLYLLLGERGEGLFLLAGAAATIGLVIFQEFRSERALAALSDLAQPKARVVRGGEQRLIPSRDLAPDDIILLSEGDRITADALLVAGDVLSVDESTLTGESAPVQKRMAQTGERFQDTTRPSPETGPYLFAGTLVVRGHGVARVERTGARSSLGMIGHSLAQIEQGQTPLQKAAGRIVFLLGLFAIAFCGLVWVAFGLMREDWIGGALAGITVAIALIPEEFPMVLAVFLALGAWRLAMHKVLVRRSAVIETLGSATMLCVDKTGTLTENHMRVARLWTDTGRKEIGADVLNASDQDLLDCAACASSVRPVDPMDRAIRELSSAMGMELMAGEPERSWPLRPEMMAVVQLWRRPDASILAAAKGAPEAIFTLCRLTPQRAQMLHGVVEQFAAEGLRVLGVARLRGCGGFPDDPADAPFEFMGLLGFLDPLRGDVVAALQEAKAAGIGVMMITGDHPATALAIAAAAGIDVGQGVLSGADIAALPLPALAKHLREGRVFARVAPEQKLLIVEALKANGEIVAMTGDGVNDAPALEAAHIGIAMGKKGADVAREAADLVLLDDGFASIVGGVRLGRRIFANLRKALIYVTAIHVPIAGLALGPIVLGLPQLLFPMHVVLLELAIDPICALAFEGERSPTSAMRRPPRPAAEPLFGPQELTTAFIQGGLVLTGVLGLYVWALTLTSEDQARGMAFIALALANLTLALTDTAGREGALFDRRRTIYWVLAGILLAVLALVLTIPGLAAIFQIETPSPPHLALSALVAVASGGSYWALARLVSGLKAGEVRA
jgi:Ca2+-transporting ATPase